MELERSTPKHHLRLALPVAGGGLALAPFVLLLVFSVPPAARQRCPTNAPAHTAARSCRKFGSCCTLGAQQYMLLALMFADSRQHHSKMLSLAATHTCCQAAILHAHRVHC